MVFKYIVNTHLTISKEAIPRMFSQNGGKITEKANAVSNVTDSTIKGNKPHKKWSNPLSVKCNTYKGVSETHSRSWNGLNLCRWQNSAMRNRACSNQFVIFNKRFYTQDSSQDRKEPFTAWPKDTASIEDKVYGQQIELARIAEKHGIGSKEVQRRQIILSRSLEFRIVAVTKLARNSGSKTAGIDKKTFENTEKFKCKLVED